MIEFALLVLVAVLILVFTWIGLAAYIDYQRDARAVEVAQEVHE